MTCEYQISQLVQQLFHSAAGPGSKMAYELQNVWAQWVMKLANSPTCTESTPSKLLVYKSTDPEDPVHAKFRSELKRLVGKEEISKVLYAAVFEIVTKMSKQDIKLDHTSIEYTLPETRRIRYLLYRYPTKHAQVREMVMLYQTVGDSGLQWGFPSRHFDALRRFGVKTSAFASPLNDRITHLTLSSRSSDSWSQHENKDFEGTGYCSCFPHIDKEFGSLGRFQDVDFLARPGHLQVNPYWSEECLLEAATRAVNLIQEAKRDYKIFFHGPNWTDAEFYKILTGLPEDRYIDILLLPKTFATEKPDGEVMQSRVANRYFCLSSVPMSADDKIKIKSVMLDGLGQK